MARGPAANGEVWTRSRRQRRVLALRERRALRKRNLPFGTGFQLGPLQNNGGPTLTHEPGPNAPPVQAGDPAFVPPPDFDHRGTGFARVIGGGVADGREYAHR